MPQGGAGVCWAGVLLLPPRPPAPSPSLTLPATDPLGSRPPSLFSPSALSPPPPCPPPDLLSHGGAHLDAVGSVRQNLGLHDRHLRKAEASEEETGGGRGGGKGQGRAMRRWAREARRGVGERCVRVFVWGGAPGRPVQMQHPSHTQHTHTHCTHTHQAVLLAQHSVAREAVGVLVDCQICGRGKGWGGVGGGAQGGGEWGEGGHGRVRGGERRSGGALVGLGSGTAHHPPTAAHNRPPTHPPEGQPVAVSILSTARHLAKRAPCS